jgi:hypothetical protein
MIPYIIKVALILGGCLAFYKILLRRETFYRTNRFTLILCLLISFSLPFVQVPQKFSLRKPEKEIAVNTPATPVLVKEQPAQLQTGTAQNTQLAPDEKKTSRATGSSLSLSQFMSWLVWLYWFGVILFAISFLFQLSILLWRAYRNPAIIDGPYRIVEVKGDKAPCSFGNNIFINPEKYDWETYNQILLHEKIHIRERHTLDILFAEIVLIFQWFNPFAWIYRREIESNLEFLTDNQLMEKKEVDKTSYQLSLVKVSAPHLPLSLTTNYNQSILKKRIAMMNTKRSNLHTAWKYFFLLPVLALLACLLNEPMAQSRPGNKNEIRNRGMDPEGYWFATIKDDKVNIRFSDEELTDDSTDFSSHHSFNSTTFKLSDLSNVPKGTSGTFTITREAGKMEFTGKFEGNMGMGRYKFTADKAYGDYMSTELKEKLDLDDQLAFFFINVRKDYLQMLRAEGFTGITKDDIMPMAALKIDAAYIKSIKDAGFKDVTAENLIPLKALDIDARYINEIRSAGYKNIEVDQLISFKAQGIDKDYIGKVRQIRGNDGKDKDKDDDANDIVTFKALSIDEDFINSFKAVGYTNIPSEQLVSMKAIGVTPEYIRSWQAAGFKNIAPDKLIGMKAQNVTPEYLKELEGMGYKNVDPEDLISFKALNITGEFIKSFENAGYKNVPLDQFTSLKALGVTPDFIKSFEAVGFKNIDLDEIVSVKAMGVTPAYITSMKEKGFNYSSLQKYVTLKSIAD